MSRGCNLDRTDILSEAKARELASSNRNWLKHLRNSTGGKIDELLFIGASVADMAKKAHTTANTVYMHLNHLRQEHHLAIVRKEGKFSYDLEAMKGDGKEQRKGRRRTARKTS